MSEYITDEIFDGDLEAVRKHYERLSDVYDNLATLGKHPTIGFAGMQGGTKMSPSRSQRCSKTVGSSELGVRHLSATGKQFLTTNSEQLVVRERSSTSQAGKTQTRSVSAS